MNSTVSVSVGYVFDWDPISEDLTTIDIADTDESRPFGWHCFSTDIDDLFASCFDKKSLSRLDNEVERLFNRERKKPERVAYDKIRYANRTPEKIAKDKIRNAIYYAKHKSQKSTYQKIRRANRTPEKIAYEKIRYTKDKSERAAHDKIRLANRTPEKFANEKIYRAKNYARRKEKDPEYLAKINARRAELRKKKKILLSG